MWSFCSTKIDKDYGMQNAHGKHKQIKFIQINLCLKQSNIVVRSHIQSALVTSKSKRLSEILRDIRTSTYQVCRIEEYINQMTTYNK